MLRAEQPGKGSRGMAGEYFKYLARNEKPREKTVLTPEEKRRNWWDYHKWHVVIGACLLIALLDIGKSVFHIGEVRPDIQVAYVGSNELSPETVLFLQEAFSALAADANGDGRTTVQVNQYASKEQAGAEAFYHTAAAEVRLMGDLEDCESFLFLLEDAETFQEQYQVLSYPNGSLPESFKDSAADCSFRWENCPVLSDLAAGYNQNSGANASAAAELSSLFLARRGFWGNKTVQNLSACEDLWVTLTKGAADR